MVINYKKLILSKRKFYKVSYKKIRRKKFIREFGVYFSKRFFSFSEAYGNGSFIKDFGYETIRFFLKPKKVFVNIPLDKLILFKKFLYSADFNDIPKELVYFEVLGNIYFQDKNSKNKLEFKKVDFELFAPYSQDFLNSFENIGEINLLEIIKNLLEKQNIKNIFVSDFKLKDKKTPFIMIDFYGKNSIKGIENQNVIFYLYSKRESKINDFSEKIDLLFNDKNFFGIKSVFSSDFALIKQKDIFHKKIIYNFYFKK